MKTGVWVSGKGCERFLLDCICASQGIVTMSPCLCIHVPLGQWPFLPLGIFLESWLGLLVFYSEVRIEYRRYLTINISRIDQQKITSLQLDVVLVLVGRRWGSLSTGNSLLVFTNSSLQFGSEVADQTLNGPSSGVTQGANSVTFDLVGQLLKKERALVNKSLR